MLATTLSLPEPLQCAWHFGCTVHTPHSALLPLHKQKQRHFIRTHIINGGSSSDDNNLLKIFQLIDANKDGLLSLDEVDLYLHKLGLQLLAHAMLALFIGEELGDGDGEAVSCLHVDFEGFSRLCESVLGRRHSQEEEEEEEEEEEDLREVFRLYDRNCDGVISAEEVEMVLGGLGLGNNVKSREGWERMIGKADTNGDGVLDFTEFKMMMTRCQPKRKTLIH